MDIRVVILEDDFYAREAVATLLQRDCAIRVVGEYAWPDELLADLSAGRSRANVCWIDLDFPDQPDSGIECVRHLRQAAPELRLICSALMLQPGYGELWAMGVSGLVLKGECGHAVGLAVSLTAEGWRVVTPGARVLLADGADPHVCVIEPVGLPRDLSPHLRRVARLRYARQLTPDQIAEELALSLSTVESYLKIIKSALYLDGRERLLTRGFMSVTRGEAR